MKFGIREIANVVFRAKNDQKIGKKPYGRKIYTIYCFLIWYERYFILEK